MQIIKISAMWCPSCIIVNKFWNDVKNENKEIDFTDLDLDMDEEKVKKYSVGNILPVVIMSNGTNEVKRLIGEKTKEEYINFIKGGL